MAKHKKREKLMKGDWRPPGKAGYRSEATVNGGNETAGAVSILGSIKMCSCCTAMYKLNNSSWINGVMEPQWQEDISSLLSACLILSVLCPSMHPQWWASYDMHAFSGTYDSIYSIFFSSMIVSAYMKHAIEGEEFLMNKAINTCAD